MSGKLRAGILGATGAVGQRFIQLLDRDPQFEVTALAASDRSEGKTYAEACTWRLPGGMPSAVKAIRVQSPHPPLDCDVIFSSLPSDMARAVEEEFARAGYPVISNSAAWRMEPDVPLLIPEVNHSHLELLGAQGSARKFAAGGYIVTNPNCSTIMLALALAPLEQRFGLESVMVTTLQALSGAGYPGVASMDATDNVVPFIENEEEKIERETLKILGRMKNGTVEAGQFRVSAQCHRVNVTDGHLGAIRVKLARPAKIEDVQDALASFTSLPQQMKLHMAPEHPIIFRAEQDRPQPRLDRDAGGGMSVTIGRLRPDKVLDFRFVALSHNTIRGAAGGTILNAEMLAASGRLNPMLARSV
jgi:aspartate-semialdehyde dehydrogenase